MNHRFPLLLLLLYIPVLRAQPPGGIPAYTSLQAGIASQVDADLEGGASFSTTDFYIEAGLGKGVGDGLLMEVSLSYGQKNYDFSGTTELSPGDPWSQVNLFDLGWFTLWNPAERWGFMFIPSLNAYAEQGADIEDALVAGLVVAGFYQVSETLRLGIGFGVSGQVEDDPEYFPFPVIEWQITERLSLENGEGFAATLGPGVGLFYQLSDQWRAGVLGRSALLRFRLDDDGVAPGGVGEDSHEAFYASLEYAAGPWSSFSLFAGYQFDGELELEDDTGDVLADEDYDDVLVFGLVGSMTF